MIKNTITQCQVYIYMHMYLCILSSVYNPTVKMPVKVLIDKGDMGSELVS